MTIIQDITTRANRCDVNFQEHVFDKWCIQTKDLNTAYLNKKVQTPPPGSLEWVSSGRRRTTAALANHIHYHSLHQVWSWKEVASHLGSISCCADNHIVIYFGFLHIIDFHYWLFAGQNVMYKYDNYCTSGNACQAPQHTIPHQKI